MNFYKPTLLVLLFIFNMSNSIAQLEGVIEYTFDDKATLAQKVIDELRSKDNFAISNVEITGNFDSLQSVGSFYNAQVAMGIDSGLILSNGYINGLYGENTSTGFSGRLGIPGDENLDFLDSIYPSPFSTGAITTYDASAIEFDFIPTKNSVSLDFVFASEEYCDYVATFFADKVGVFLSGPNIDGPFLLSGQSAINIATTIDENNVELPITINRINAFINSDFYIDNNTEFTSSAIGACPTLDVSSNLFTQLCQFDGWTVPLSASYDSLIIGQTYHLRIVIADSHDSDFDSAIFLKHGSLHAGQDVVANAGFDKAITCSIPQVTLGSDSTSVGSEIIYEWTSTIEDFVSDQQFPTVVEAGQYFLKVTNSISGQMAFDTLIVSADFDAPNLTISSPDILDCNNVSIVLEAELDTVGANFQYLWTGPNSFSQATPNVEVFDCGDYSLILTNLDNGCSAIATTTVLCDLELPTLNIASPSFLVSGVPMQLDASGSSMGSNYSYEWTTSNGSITAGQNTLTPTISSPGEYCLSVINESNACQSDTCVTVFLADLVQADAGPDKELNCYVNQVSLGGSASSIGPNLMYTWVIDGAVISNELFINVENSGIYVLTILDTITGVVDMDTVEVIENIQAPNFSIDTPSFISCQNSSVDLRAIWSDVGEFSFEWSTSNGSIDSDPFMQSISVSFSGTYTLNVTNLLNGCSSSVSVDVENNLDQPFTMVSEALNINPGETIQLSGLGSTTGVDFEYLWTSSNGNILDGANTLAPTVSSAGNYCLMVTDITNGCQSIGCVQVMLNNIVVADAGPNQTITCDESTVIIGGQNSSMGLGLSYAWADQNGIPFSNDLYTEVTIPGMYILNVMDTLLGGSAIDTVVIFIDNQIPNISIASPNILDCINSTVILDASQSSGTASLNYTWIGPNGLVGSDLSTWEVSECGIYTLVLTNLGNGCTAEQVVEVNCDFDVPQIAIQFPESLIPGEAELLDGTGSSTGTDITYSWTTTNGNFVSGESTLTPIIDQAGTYCLTLTNLSNGCDRTECVEVLLGEIQTMLIADAGPPQVITCATPAFSLGGPNTSMGPEFTYAWIDGAGNLIGDTPFIDVSQVDSYTLVVTNTETGEEASDSVLFINNTTVPTVFITLPEMLTCVNQTVILDAVVQNDAEYLTFLWSTSIGNFVSDPNLEDVTIDAPGDYTLTVIDTTNHCESISTVIVELNIDIPNVAIAQPDLLACNVSSILINASASDQEQLTYSWSTTNGNILSDPSLLDITVDAPGAYTLVVTDTENGCSASDTVIVDEDTNILISVNSGPILITCDTFSYLDPSSIGIDSLCSYTWLPQAGLIVDSDTSLIATIFTSGTYTLVKTDSVGCMENFLFTGVVAEEVVADAGPDQMLTCMIDSVFIGGPDNSLGPNISYAWSNLNAPVGFGPSLLVNSPGLYELVVTDSNTGCSATDQVVVSSADSFTLDVKYTDISCFGLADGTIEILPSGGAPPYEITTPIPMTNLAAGIYTIAATDANGCMEEVSIEIVEPQQLKIEIEITDMNEIFANVSGGVMPYTYDWSDGSDSTTVTEPINGTTYTLNITDANGCTLSDELFYVFDAVGQVRAQELDCYPNPALDYVVLELEDIAIGLSHFEILDLQGRSMTLVQSFSGPDKMKVQVNDFSPGTYFIHAIVNDQLFYQKLIIIE